MNTVEQVWAKTNREMWIVTSAHEKRGGGLVATFVTQASIVPSYPRVIVGLAKQHHTWSLIEDSGAFGLNLLKVDQVELVWHFGLQSGRDVDKLAGIATKTAKTGSPLLQESVAWLDCRVERGFDTGDRTLYLGEVVAAEIQSDAEPLTIKQVLQATSAETMQTMRADLERDAAIDAEAIEAWRRSVK